ncbi:MAG: hypothetical protein QOD26_3430, partial [Betaproteobacteria bacterium]|nr:hypothetical protein [Betaproteobacteria bacterium]
MKIGALIVLLACCVPPAVAQEPARIALRADIVGAWVLVPVPDALQPPTIKKSPWPAACQYFRYFADGRLATLMKHPGPCEKLTAAMLDEAFDEQPTPIKFEYAASRDDPLKGLLFVTRTDAPKYREIWEPRLFLEDTQINGVRYRKGDL